MRCGNVFANTDPNLTRQLDPNWKFEVDNEPTDVLADVIRESGGRLALPELRNRKTLCENCSKIDFSDIALSFYRDTEDFDPDCDLCELLQNAYTDAYSNQTRGGSAHVKFRKEGSRLIMNETGAHALSILGRLGRRPIPSLFTCHP